MRFEQGVNHRSVFDGDGQRDTGDRVSFEPDALLVDQHLCEDLKAWFGFAIGIKSSHSQNKMQALVLRPVVAKAARSLSGARH